MKKIVYLFLFDITISSLKAMDHHQMPILTPLTLEQLKKDIDENPNSTLAKQKASLIEASKKMKEESKKAGAPRV